MPTPVSQRAKKAEYDRRRRASKHAELLERAQLYREANREKVRRQVREAKRRRYQADPETVRRANTLANRRWRKANPDKGREATKRYLKAHPEKRSEQEALRRARKRGAPVERVDRDAVWRRDLGICGLCGEAANRADWHLDHVVPLARGGTHTYGNTQVAHPLCNVRKGARDA